MNEFAERGLSGAPELIHALLPFMLPLILWSLLWKGLALWHSARHGQPVWFLILLVVNTLGILEIVYLFAVLKIKVNDLFKK